MSPPWPVCQLKALDADNVYGSFPLMCDFLSMWCDRTNRQGSSPGREEGAHCQCLVLSAGVGLASKSAEWQPQHLRPDPKPEGRGKKAFPPFICSGHSVTDTKSCVVGGEGLRLCHGYPHLVGEYAES